MGAIDFIPANSLEELLVSAVNGEVQISDFIPVFVDSNIFVPSATEVNSDLADIQPVLFDKDGQYMLAVFTDIKKAEIYSDKAKYCLSIKTIDLLKKIPSGDGVVLNPGYKVGFELSSEGIKNIVRDFA